MDAAGTPVERPRWLLVAGVVVAAAALVVGAALLVGPKPREAEDGASSTPPPLALPSNVDDGSPLAKAAVLLAAGRLDEAREAFVDVVAKEPEGVAGQVGLVLSRWSSTGPRSVERDLRQLAAEYPEDALVALHLGLAQLALEEDRLARVTLQGARELGRSAGDATSLRMATLADDVLHPRTFRGPMPVLVQAREVRREDRAAVQRLVTAASTGDHERAVREAKALAASPDGFTRLATIAGTFDKAAPTETVARFEDVANDESIAADVRDRAVLLGAIADLWGGADRVVGCRALERAAGSAAAQATRRLAGPIRAELCAHSG